MKLKSPNQLWLNVVTLTPIKWQNEGDKQGAIICYSSFRTIF
jgi:hypothetical protein